MIFKYETIVFDFEKYLFLINLILDKLLWQEKSLFHFILLSELRERNGIE